MTFRDKLDELLGLTIGSVSVRFMSHPDGQNIIMPTEDLIGIQETTRKQIIDLIKAEIIGEAEPRTSGETNNLQSKKRRIRNAIRDEQRKKLEEK